MIIGKYQYVYGSGASPNREIEFWRENESNSNIFAKAYAFVRGQKIEICIVPSKAIDVELWSTSEKVAALKARRDNQNISQQPKNKPLADYSGNEQNKIIQNLEPEGVYRLEIINGIGKDRTHEKVLHLTFFNPS